MSASGTYQEREKGSALEDKLKASGYKASETPSACAKGDRFYLEQGTTKINEKSEARPKCEPRKPIID